MKMDTMKYCLMENDCDKIIRIIDDEKELMSLKVLMKIRFNEVCNCR